MKLYNDLAKTDKEEVIKFWAGKFCIYGVDTVNIHRDNQNSSFWDSSFHKRIINNIYIYI